MHMISYILFFIGFALFIKGADWLVTGASSLAYKFGISALVVGLTIVAFGTSAPELIVSVLASSSGNVDIAIGNITGSNIANILLILGVSSIVYPLSVQKSTVWKEIPFAVLAVLVLMVMANDRLVDGALGSFISRTDGLVLIAFFVIFLYYIFDLISRESASKNEKELEGEVNTTFKPWIVTAQIIGGLIGLTLGGKWVVDGAVFFATTLGVSQSLIGLTIVAVGTSLPEFATSVVAAYKKNADIAVGNIVGSNIFNIFWILGCSAVLRPLSFSSGKNIDLFVALIATLFLFFALFVGKKHIIEKWQGVIFVILYVGYVGYLISIG